MLEALVIIASLEDKRISAAALARLLWPDHEAWVSGNSKRRKALAMAAGGLVGRLRSNGYVHGFCGSRFGISITPKGRDLIDGKAL